MITPDTATFTRISRFRRTPALRALRRETCLSASDLILPLFVVDDPAMAGPIPSLPGVRRCTPRQAAEAARAAADLGVPGVLVFGVPDAADKDVAGSAAHEADGVVPRAVREIRGRAPDLAVFTDACLCQYTSHGQCGVPACSTLGEQPEIDHDRTLDIIARIAIAHAEAGADAIAPSGMIDGAVAVIRAALDGAGFAQTAILPYSVKYASSFYGPFRDATLCASRGIDRRAHQLDPANAREALAEAAADLAEGADALMVKPAGPYLDVIAALRARHPGTPLAAYQVSGEYAMIAAAAAAGWIDERAAMLESLLAIKRAGADMIITYAAAAVARWLNGDRPPAGLEGRA